MWKYPLMSKDVYKRQGEKGSQEEKELTGTIDDIKDFMFVVTDDKDTPYSLSLIHIYHRDRECHREHRSSKSRCDGRNGKRSG